MGNDSFLSRPNINWNKLHAEAFHKYSITRENTVTETIIIILRKF